MTDRQQGFENGQRDADDLTNSNISSRIVACVTTVANAHRDGYRDVAEYNLGYIAGLAMKIKVL